MSATVVCEWQVAIGLCSRHLIPIFSVGHIPFVLLKCQLAQHGVVECGLVCVKREREVCGEEWVGGARCTWLG